MFSKFEHYYSINESVKIEIDQINNLKDDKLFVSVGGGIGAGKTYLTKKFIQLPIIDIDDFIVKESNGIYNRSNLYIGRKKFNIALDKSLNENQSFVHMGTNTNLNGTKTRLEIAKKNNFTNILVYVDTNPDIAEKQSLQRVNLAERNQISKERIIQSHDDSFNVFNTLIKDNKLVDFYVIFKR